MVGGKRVDFEVAADAVLQTGKNLGPLGHKTVLGAGAVAVKRALSCVGGRVCDLAEVVLSVPTIQAILKRRVLEKVLSS